MKVKSKICKGNGLAKGYGCGDLTMHRVYGLCKMKCYPNWLLNSENGKIKLNKSILKATRQRTDYESAEKEHKERKGLTTLIKSVVNVFHEYVRERDKGKPCIACSTQWKKDFQASHFFKAELYTSLKLHELNVHSGCMECNLRKEGNLSEYLENLPERIGQDNFNELNRLAQLDKQIDFKWNREDLIKTRKHYQQLLKEIR